MTRQTEAISGLQPPITVLHTLSQAVERCFLALGLKDSISFLWGLFSGPRQLPPKGIPSQEVKDRIHAAVEAGEPPCHLVGGIYSVVKLTHIRALKVEPGPHVEVLHDVERQVGDGKDCKHDDNKMYGFLPQGCIVHIIVD